MPLLILGVGITEPLPTRRAVYRRRVGARRIARRDTLAQPLQVRALVFLFFHPHDTPRVAILPRLSVCRRSESTYPITAALASNLGACFTTSRLRVECCIDQLRPPRYA